MRRRALPVIGFTLLAVPAAAQAPAPSPSRPAWNPSSREAPWKGDLDGMLQRRRIRALVPYSRTTYFVERGVPRGASYDALAAFETEINRRHRTGKLKCHVVFVVTPRDQLLSALLAGRGDVAAGALTVTPARSRLVEFSQPFATGIDEVVVTGPYSPTLSTLDDLSGREVTVRRSSSYWEHLEQLNQSLAQRGKAAVVLRAAPEALEDEDLLEMLNAGLFAIGVVDTHKLDLWAEVFTHVKAHRALTVNQGGQIAWALQPGTPLLRAAVDAFARSHGAGTVFGNSIRRRYAGTRLVRRATGPAELRKFEEVADLFRHYGRRYQLDPLLVMAQGYQESRLDHGARSRAGAVGIMQVLPATGRDMRVGDVTRLEANIHAGVKYLRFVIDTFFADEPMDPLNKGLFAFAAYNAGPGRIRQLRRVAGERGLDPHRWFNNVEVVVAERVGAETVTYVSNIYKYYVAYRMLADREEERRKAREAARLPRA
jgi:membrane-bound lytic murein transglycosylase MltF